MTAREYPVFTVTPKAERSLRAGHPWVYGEEVTAVAGEYQNGDMVDVVSNKGRYLGTGWVNDHCKIRVRIISRDANDTCDEAFLCGSAMELTPVLSVDRYVIGNGTCGEITDSLHKAYQD